MNEDTISEPDTCRRCGAFVLGAGYECLCDNCAADLANSYMDDGPEPFTEEEQERFSKELEDCWEASMKYQKKP
jgi:hypothetical protein